MKNYKKTMLVLAVIFLAACSKDTSKLKKATAEYKSVKQKKEKTLVSQKERKKPSEPHHEEKVEKVEIMVESEEVISIYDKVRKPHKLAKAKKSAPTSSHRYLLGAVNRARMPSSPPVRYMERNSEDYANTKENSFKNVLTDPLSTFSIDVDAASYSNMRRFLNQSKLPPQNAIRVEEMINYFSYDYKQPTNNTPFSVNHEYGTCPWNSKHQLVHIGIQGKNIPTDNLPASNLVFLLDVSGSMNSPNKLGLLKKSFHLLVDNLREQDKVAIVVYAGAAGLVLPSTSGADKQKIKNALSNLNAGGSTAGGAGIKLAYKIAKENMMPNGNNRIIIATDGDFNVGASSNEAMEDLIAAKRKEGVFLTVLGFGMGNYKDSKMEILADKGNGNYAYIDDILEANKVLGKELGGTLHTIAKDVKIQVEFNPAVVKAYRLVGYENRLLNKEDFNDDKKDAGELGSGHTVTALYELVMAGSNENVPSVDPLKYQKQERIDIDKISTDELMTVKIRYKKPKEDKSKLIEEVIKNKKAEKLSTNFQFSAAVASFGMLLSRSDYNEDMTYESIISLAKQYKGKDEQGYRAEFIRLVEKASLLDDGLN